MRTGFKQAECRYQSGRCQGELFQKCSTFLEFLEGCCGVAVQPVGGLQQLLDPLKEDALCHRSHFGIVRSILKVHEDIIEANCKVRSLRVPTMVRPMPRIRRLRKSISRDDTAP